MLLDPLISDRMWQGVEHSLAGEGVGGPKYSEWTESLALCILCAMNWVRRAKFHNKKSANNL